MIKYILKRFVWAIVVLFGILTTTFIFLKIQPTEVPIEVNAKRTWLAQQYERGYMTRFYVDGTEADEVAKWQEIAKTNDDVFWVWQAPNSKDRLIVYENVPIMMQYGKWLVNVVTKFDWGTSATLKVSRPVTEILGSAIEYSFKINIFVLILQIPLGLILGIASALKKDSVFDNIAQILIMVFISLPSFVVVSLLMKYLGNDLNWVPFTWPAADNSFETRALGYVIPVLAMTIGSIAGLARSVRAELAEGLTSEYVLLARTKGLSNKQAIFRHALRNSLLPIIPGLLFSFVGLISGSAIIERIYSIPGAGKIMLDALFARDYNVIMYDTAFYGFIGLVCGIFMDISYGFIDPRIKMGARNG